MYRHNGKRRDPKTGSASEWKYMCQTVRLSFKSLIWTIATSKRNYVYELLITISFLWFLCWNIIKHLFNKFISLFIKQLCTYCKTKYYFLKHFLSPMVTSYKFFIVNHYVIVMGYLFKFLFYFSLLEVFSKLFIF